MSLRLRTLGGLSLETSGAAVPGRTTQRKRLALLALLAAHPDGGLSRDKILAYLWPERDAENGRHALSQILYALRRDLGNDVIEAGIDDLRLNDAVVTSDVAELLAAISVRDSTRIAALYSGPFLDGVFISDAPEFEEWAAQTRVQLQRAYAAALDELGRQALASGNAADAVAWLHKRAALDPLNSDVILRLMRASVAANDRAGALRCYRTHVALLREEMGLEPPPELVEAARECAEPALAEQPIVRMAATAPSAIQHEAPTQVGVRPIRPRRRRLIAGGALAALIGVVILGTRERNDVASHVLLATVTGPDTSLALAVREALRAELEQSESVRVLNDIAAAQTLELMLLPPSTPLSENIATEIAERRGVPFVISASVHPIGGGAQIVARMIETRSGDVIATATERPTDDAAILAAVGKIASKMRERVPGAREVARSALPAVSTRSLPALRNYALARYYAHRWERERGLELVEAALVHDSTFALAHYLAADLLWYIDKQKHSDDHIARALQLVAQLPSREQLIVKARYQQLVLDQPDSALVYWRLLADSYPDEPLAYEGMRWVHRALGEVKQMAAASRLAYRYDPNMRAPYLTDRMEERLAAHDTGAAFAAARELVPLFRSQPARAEFLWRLRIAETPPLELANRVPKADQQYVLLLYHRIEQADTIAQALRDASLQYYPRALLAQARVEFECAPGSTRPAAYLAELITWIENADLSPPAYARLAERAAELAAQMRDQQSLRRLRRLIDAKDNGRQLRSYRIVLATIRAAEAYADGEYREAARLAADVPRDMFYARSVATVVMLQADALRRSGDMDDARRLYHEILRRDEFLDGDPETLGLIRHLVAHRLEAQEAEGT